MNYKKFLGAASAALMIAIVVTLVLASGAWAQSKYKTLYKFKGGKNGAGPWAGLIFDPVGNLYGTTSYGGASGYGTVFKLTPNANGSWTKSVLHTFNGSDGENPRGGVVFDAAGNLYGATPAGGNKSYCYGDGCGVVFKLTPNANGTWTESLLHSFSGSDGERPNGSLIFDTTGNLYGTTNGGGASGWGTVFNLTPNADGSWTESVLYSFERRGHFDADGPAAGLIFDQAGNLYGTTLRNDAHLQNGAVFELTPNVDGSWTESVLYTFPGGKDGYGPFGGLILDAAGDLFGTTLYGGGTRRDCLRACGVVFKLTLSPGGTWTESVLHSFRKSNGEYPYAGLILDAAGNLYGTTEEGGNVSDCNGQGCGVVFKLTPNADGSWTESVLHSFNGTDGEYLGGTLIFDTNGNLYGTTAGDGSTTFGTVFEITP